MIPLSYSNVQLLSLQLQCHTPSKIMSSAARKNATHAAANIGFSLGAAGIISGLPVLVYSFFFLCNDVSGCPVPALLDLRSMSWPSLKTQIPWPAGGFVWVPFIYSTQCRYLSIYPVQLGMVGLTALTGVFAIGVYIFRAANTQKTVFRKSPNDPSVASLTYIQTKHGTKLLTSGWW